MDGGLNPLNQVNVSNLIKEFGEFVVLDNGLNPLNQVNVSNHTYWCAYDQLSRGVLIP